MFKRIPWKTGWPVKLSGISSRSATFIGLGVNIGTHGERVRLLKFALEKINQTPGTCVLAVSSIYETPPWGVTEQAEFYNAAIAIQTGLSPVALLHILKSIEVQLGRKHRKRWGPREIDLDILIAGDLVLGLAGLNVPHKYLARREFALAPVLEIAPRIQFPYGRRLSSIVGRNSERLSDKPVTINPV